MAGFGASALIALPLGLYIGIYRPVQAFLEPLTDFIRYMPAVALIPMVQAFLEPLRSEEHTSELQSLMRTSYHAFCLTKKIYQRIHTQHNTNHLYKTTKP